MLRSYESCPSDRSHQNVSLGCHLGEVASFGVADGHRRALVQQQSSHRFANDIAAADDQSIYSGDLDAGPLQYLDNARRGARSESGIALHQASGVDRVKAVHVLRRIDPLENSSLVDVLWQGKLNEDAVNI